MLNLQQLLPHIAEPFIFHQAARLPDKAVQLINRAVRLNADIVLADPAADHRRLSFIARTRIDRHSFFLPLDTQNHIITV
ncbi:hypothetical protein D3C73_1020190 [compost metagenome]